MAQLANNGTGAPGACPELAEGVREPDGWEVRTSGGKAIPAATQLLAIAWMRWRMFANSFRRSSKTQRQIVGVVFAIILRLILWPIFALMALGPTIGCGYFAWRAIAHHHARDLAPLLAAVFLGWQFVAVNGASIAAAASNFDPASLLRFPLRFGRYLVLRLLLGFLTPSTIIGCLALLAAAIGITLADSSLALPAFIALGIYALMNIFFARMLGVWLERWLATRRAREIFGVLMAFIIVGFQYFNINQRHVIRHSSASNSWLLNFLNGQHSFLTWLPPGYATQSIAFSAHPAAGLLGFAALLLWTAAFFAALAFRLRKQFLGEYLTEGAPRATALAPRSPSRPAAPVTLANQQPATGYLLPATGFFSPTIAACLRKEWVYLRGNFNQMVSMLMPLVFVFILGRGRLIHDPAYLLAGAVAYSMMGLLATLYNIFGVDGAGVQLYLLAPVRMRDVVVAKNIASLTLLSLVAAVAWVFTLFIAPQPVPLATQIATFFWVVFMLFANVGLGTLRSIQSPMRITTAQTRRMRSAAANKTSGLLVLAVLMGSFLLQVPVALFSRHYSLPWLGVFVFVPLAALAVGAYALLLRDVDYQILTHRDTLAQNLYGD